LKSHEKLGVLVKFLPKKKKKKTLKGWFSETLTIVGSTKN